MSKVVLCPICGGKGKILDIDNKWLPTEYDNGTNAYKTCHGCGGKGWVEVREW